MGCRVELWVEEVTQNERKMFPKWYIVVVVIVVVAVIVPADVTELTDM